MVNDHSRNTLIESITNTIADYRLGEISPITPDHVDRWVCQFEIEDQLIILSELNSILKSYYISKPIAQYILTRALTSKKIFGANPAQIIPKLKFLQIQRKGNSQKSILSLADEITKSEYGISIDNCGQSPIGYVYLDDCLFSGNTAYHDLEAWLADAIPRTTLYLIFLAAHTNGLHYLQNKFNPEAEKKHISLIYKQWYLFNNRTYNKDKYDCLWARQITNDELVDRFISRVQERCQGQNFTPRIFRPDGTPEQETLFSSPEARDIVERAFLKAGAYIVSLPKKPKFEMRPMGYEYLESLGFGAMFITYRNIANNCPLALWWGDSSFPPNHPFSKWYPLFPRKVNESSSNFGNLDIVDF